MRLLFITSARVEGPVNQNHFQRLAILSEQLPLTILAPRGASFPTASGNGARVIAPRLPGKAGVLLQSVFLAFQSRAQRFDVVLTDPSVLGLGGAILKWITGCRWVVDVWDIPIRCHSTGGWSRTRASMIRCLLRRVYRSADRFIVSIVPDQELGWFQIPPAKLASFGNAIWWDETARFSNGLTGPNDSQEILCSRSSYTGDMGLDTLAAAFLKVRILFTNARLTIIGEIPEAVKSQVAALAGLPQVQILGLIQHKELVARIAASDICVIPFKDVPDLSQTYPIKLLEYLRLGKPVVASNIRGMAQLIAHGHNGVLFRAGDVDDLARTLGELIASPGLASRLAEQGRNLHSKFDAKVKGKAIVSLLQELAAN